MQKGFIPVIPLLFVAFILTSVVALRSQSKMVLGERIEALTQDRKEIRDVKVERTEPKNVRNRNKIEIKEEIKLRVNERLINIKKVRENETEIKDETASDEGKVRVRTNFPITIDQVENTMTVKTPKGNVMVKELPSTAIENMIEKGLIETVNDAQIIESSDSASLFVRGENHYRFLGIIPVKANVAAEVDQETGDLTKLTTPWYISTFGFLFRK